MRDAAEPTVTDPYATFKHADDVPPARGTGRLYLAVIGEGVDATRPLPDDGRVVIGRSDDATLRIDHRSVSRHHAAIAVGAQLTIQDLGSANGTRVRGRRLIPNQIAAIACGEPIDLGDVMIVVQERVATAPPRHVWEHGHFEARVEEECARSEKSGARFAVMRIHAEQDDASIEPAIARELRSMDVIGRYGPGEYEVLLVDSDPAIVDETAARVRAACAGARVGIACYPTDARDPYALLRAAGAAARGETTGETPIRIVDAAHSSFDRLVERVAASTISVLITGETGVGKEVLAERLHKLSPRAAKPFLQLHCAALPEALLESELFGHEKGAFTGAEKAKPGLLETANGGTVFLDEIGELPASTQVKLLRVIETRQVLAVGALAPRPIDVRFLAATHRDLEAEIERGAFRQDLYFRLNGVALAIPPLRHRVPEIAPLARAFLRQNGERNDRLPPGISDEALALLEAYAWPGNIRELRNVIERAALLCTGSSIEVSHLPAETMRTRRAPVEPAPLPPPPDTSEPDLDTDPERRRIREALAATGGNQTEAAKLVGVSRRTLINRMIAFDIPRPRKR
jgi:DNA-binding NtrC family response regulator